MRAEGVKKWFYDRKRGEFPAVDDVSFECKKGEVFGLLGPNGAGKTTTLMIITTILKPDAGKVEVNGFDVATNPESARLNFGFVSADAALYDLLTPRETLEFVGKLSKYPKEKLAARIDELIKLLDMSSFADTRCQALSTGMKQRVAIARALVHDPPVVIMDEPTSGLDVPTMQSVYQLVRQCREMGKCVLFSTHIMSEAEKLCDRIGIINKGKVLAMGTLSELKEQYAKSDLEEIFLAVVGGIGGNENNGS
ncbi:MAG: ABC transporter ATP-binding protein [Candidatus Melainabacteria bacterium]|nr:MAG: ABC transporter ATP-binding protein [Candidatus Melainabacteria bacterium]